MGLVELELDEKIEDVEVKMIKLRLISLNGNLTKSALSLGISLRTLHNKMKKHEIKREDYLGRKNT